MAGMGYPGGGGGGAMQCVSKVELRIECLNLRNRDSMSKSDPCAVLFLHDGHKWREVRKIGCKDVWSLSQSVICDFVILLSAVHTCTIWKIRCKDLCVTETICDFIILLNAIHTYMYNMKNLM